MHKLTRKNNLTKGEIDVKITGRVKMLFTRCTKSELLQIPVKQNMIIDFFPTNSFHILVSESGFLFCVDFYFFIQQSYCKGAKCMHDLWHLRGKKYAIQLHTNH